jgi:hypothetical protein
LGAFPFQFFNQTPVLKINYLQKKKLEGQPGFCHSLFCMQPTATKQKELKQMAQSLAQQCSEATPEL